MKKILIIEDEKRISNIVKDFLEENEFKVIQAFNGEKGLDLYFDQSKLDLILLDVMLPKKDGWTVLREIKQDNLDIPIIMLTARGQESDEIFGFDLGADDYVTKPFSMKILIARIKALLKRNKQKNGKISYDWFTLDTLKHKLFIKENPIDLTPIEYKLFDYLLKNKNIALSREKILNNVWGYDYYGDIRTVDTHIKRLRKKIKPFDKEIKTIRGVGYLLEV
ncbi:MAG: response regulator transcription factor [Bacillota bacterium]